LGVLDARQRSNPSSASSSTPAPSTLSTSVRTATVNSISRARPTRTITRSASSAADLVPSVRWRPATELVRSMGVSRIRVYLNELMPNIRRSGISRRGLARMSGQPVSAAAWLVEGGWCCRYLCAGQIIPAPVRAYAGSELPPGRTVRHLDC
jgi:hypothetical protein